MRVFFRRSKRGVIRDNAAQGRSGERRVRDRYEMSGYKMKRTGRGHDFKATRSNWLTGKKETKYVEVKTGGAKLSPLQKRKKRSLGKKYVVEKGDPMFSFGSPSKGRSKKSAGSSLFGSPSKGRSKKSAGSSLFGSPSKGRSKKSAGSSLFGSPSKGRRSRAPKWTI